MLAEPIAVTMIVADALEALGVPYAIGGSLASAVHGVMRATMDADLVADLRPEHAEPLVRALGDAFYADAEMIRDAIRRHGSFNLIHLGTMFKVDIFVAKPRPFDRSQLARRQLHLLSEDPERHAYVTSAEDIILSKLEWYRQGGEVSARWDWLARYARKLGRRAVAQRLGYLLELYDLGTPSLIESLQEMVGASYARLDPLLPDGGPYLARWRLRLNLEPETLQAIVRT